MERGARRSKRLRDDAINVFDDDDKDAKLLRLEEEKRQLKEEKRQLKEEKRQLEREKGQLEEDKGLLEMERDQAKNILKEHASLVECPVCLMLPREDKPVPCCPQGHFVCSPCKDKLIIRQQGSISITELI